MTLTKTELKKVIFTLDIDYLELVDCIGLDYTKRGHDLKVSVYLDEDEIKESNTFIGKYMNSL